MYLFYGEQLEIATVMLSGAWKVAKLGFLG